MRTARNLAILIFEDVKVRDFCGPFEVFSIASRFTESPAFSVLTVAENAGPFVTRAGLSDSLSSTSRKSLKGECRQDKAGCFVSWPSYLNSLMRFSFYLIGSFIRYSGS